MQWHTRTNPINIKIIKIKIRGLWDLSHRLASQYSNGTPPKSYKIVSQSNFFKVNYLVMCLFIINIVQICYCCGLLFLNLPLSHRNEQP